MYPLPKISDKELVTLVKWFTATYQVDIFFDWVVNGQYILMNMKRGDTWAKDTKIPYNEATPEYISKILLELEEIIRTKDGGSEMKYLYSAIDAWNELIDICYSKERRVEIEHLMELISLGLYDFLPRWTILVGDPGTGKSMLLNVICRLFQGSWTPVSHDTMDYGQYDNVLAISHDADVVKIYQNVKENWTRSKNTHFLLATNALYTVRDYDVGLNMYIPKWINGNYEEEGNYISGIPEDHLVIATTGQRVSLDRYKELIELIDANIPVLRMYFHYKAEKDFMDKAL